MEGAGHADDDTVLDQPGCGGRDDYGVLVADRQRWVADAIARWLQDEGFNVLGTVSDGTSVAQAVLHPMCRLVLIDVALPPAGGVSAAVRAVALSPQTRVVLLSDGTCAISAAEARALGLSGCVSKEAPPAQVIRWLRAACSGDPPLQDVAGQSGPAVGGLTSRESEILRLLGEGASGRRIADALGISHHTVRTHIQNILGKLNARSRIEAVALASARGLLGKRRDATLDALRQLG